MQPDSSHTPLSLIIRNDLAEDILYTATRNIGPTLRNRNSLRPDSFYSEAAIELRLNTEVARIDTKERQATTRDGEHFTYDRLLLATGAEPRRLPIPGANLPHVHTLRSLADCQVIIAAAKAAPRVLVIGASFIGLEVAASMRARGLEVHAVAPEKRLMERILGAQMGDFIRGLHEQHGVQFHLGDTVAAIESQRATLKSGQVLEAGLVVVGIGVRPRLALAEQAGLAIDRGVLVNENLETSISGIYAAGDIARWRFSRGGNGLIKGAWGRPGASRLEMIPYPVARYEP